MNLMTKELEKKFEKYPLNSQEDKGGDAIVLVKYFNPMGVGTWLITEGNKLPNGDYEMFGYCCLIDDVNAEFGYVMLSELEKIQLPFGLKIEKDLYLKNNCTLIEAMEQSGLSVPDYLLKDNGIDLSYIEECVDYPTLKASFTKEELVEINNVIKDFESYVNKYDDGIKDIITEYEMRYGNDNIIEWYEGLKSTKSFIENYNLEKNKIDSIELETNLNNYLEEPYFDLITNLGNINDSDSFTVARVCKGINCVELHYDNGLATIEYGTRIASDECENEVEGASWFNKNINEKDLENKLWDLFNKNFSEECNYEL